MSSYRQLPEVFRRLHPRFKTPWLSLIVFAGVFSCLFMLPGNVDFIGRMYAFGAMLSFTIAHVAVIELRRKPPAGRGAVPRPPEPPLPGRQLAALRRRRRRSGPRVAWLVVVVQDAPTRYAGSAGSRSASCSTRSTAGGSGIPLRETSRRAAPARAGDRARVPQHPRADRGGARVGRRRSTSPPGSPPSAGDDRRAARRDRRADGPAARRRWPRRRARRPPARRRAQPGRALRRADGRAPRARAQPGRAIVEEARAPPERDRRPRRPARPSASRSSARPSTTCSRTPRAASWSLRARRWREGDITYRGSASRSPRRSWARGRDARRHRRARRRPLGFLLGVLFIAAGIGRLYLLRRLAEPVARKLPGLRRELDAPLALLGRLRRDRLVDLLRPRGRSRCTRSASRRSCCSSPAWCSSLVALSYAEATTALPETGGAATFVRRAVNDLAGFMTGWVLFLDYLIVIALAALFAPHYLAAALHADSLRAQPVGRDRRRCCVIVGCRRRSGSSGGPRSTRSASSSPRSTC